MADGEETSIPLQVFDDSRAGLLASSSTSEGFMLEDDFTPVKIHGDDDDGVDDDLQTWHRDPMRRRWEAFKAFVKRNLLLILTIVFAFVGFLVGALVGTMPGGPPRVAVELLKLPGTLFLRMLKAVTVPLLVTGVTVSVASLKVQDNSTEGGDPKRAKKLGLCTMAMYGVTIVLAVILGLVLVLVIQPGKLADVESGPDDPSQVHVALDD